MYVCEWPAGREITHHGPLRPEETFMRVQFTLLTLGLAFATSALATEETQLVESINAWRSQI